ncbi:MAG: cadherin-like beta sandwich domain-containing protein [Gammaproteobacteria bacterium]|nr:cadherin-like beta sandwich domain-containing protein [Gammaproteobacteria bacterium]
MHGFGRIALISAVLATALTGCGGGGNSSSRTGFNPEPPVISSDASLAELTASAADFDQIFQPTIFDYTGTASYLARTTAIMAAPTHGNATLTINGIAGSPGEPSGPIDLLEGNNVITVTVTAEDGVSSQSYTVDMGRNGASALAPRWFIKAADNGADDRFGARVAISDGTLAVVAGGEDSAATGVNGNSADNSADNSGAVYVFGRDAASTWTQEAYIKASNTANSDAFGHAIALSGDTLAVSAFQEDSAAAGIDGDDSDNSAIDAGAVYIFTRDVTGIWSQQAYLKASNTDPVDGFGVSVALDGDTLVVGASYEDALVSGVDGNQADNNGPDSGAVYVFTRDAAGLWTQQAYLKASNPDAGDRFGGAVSLSGDTLAVGAAYERSKSTGIDGNQASNSWSEAGAVYVFTRDDVGDWSQQAYLKASNTGSGDRFGDSLVLSGDTLVVGAPLEDSAARGIDGFQADNKALNSGAAYIFSRDVTGNWSQQNYLKGSNTDSQDQFGHSIALDGDLLVVGAFEDSNAVGAGGDPSDNSAPNAGAAYLFERDAMGAWSQIAYLKASNTDAGDEFGSAIAIDGNSLLVGAPLEDSVATGVGGDQTGNDSIDSGAVYLYQ